MLRFSTFFLLLVLLSCRPPVSITETRTETIRLNNTQENTDTAITNIIAPYRQKLEKEMNEVLGNTDTLLDKGQPESMLGNFVADLILMRGNIRMSSQLGYNANICLLNNGGLRTTLPKGTITRGKIYELMPFDNQLVALTISGQKMEELVKYLAASGGMPVSGLTMKIKNKTPNAVLINGKAPDYTQQYVVLTSDYLAAGGDKMSFFSNPIKTDTLDYLLRDAIIDHIKLLQLEGKSVSSRLDGRIANE